MQTSFDDNQNITRTIFEDLDGFILSAVLMAAIELDLFTTIGDAEVSTDSLFKALDIQSQEGGRFLSIFSKYGYLVENNGRYRLSDLGIRILNEYPRFKAYQESRKTVYEDLGFLSQKIRGAVGQSQTSDMWVYQGEESHIDRLEESAVLEYSLNMDASSSFWANVILDAVDISSFGSLLDVGGGGGAMANEVAARHPSFDVGIFDLVQVGNLVKGQSLGGGLRTNVKFFAGNFFQDPLPKPFNLATLVRVLWDWPDNKVFKILSAIYDMLPSAGCVMICEGLYIGDKLLDRKSADHDIRLFLVDGKIRTFSEYSDLLMNVGFENIRVLDTRVEYFKIVQGFKP